MATLVGLLTLAVTLSWQPLLDLDRTVANAAYDISSGRDGFVAFLRELARWSSGVVIRPVLVVVAAILAWRRAWRLCIWLLTSAAVGAVLSPTLKLLIERPRPSYDPPLAVLATFSYPSGHAITGGTLAAAGVLLTTTALHRGRLRAALNAVWVVLGVAIGLDRIFLGVHYLSDVVAGELIGISVTLTAWLLVVRHGALAPQPARGSEPGRPAPRFAVIVNPVHVAQPETWRNSVDAAAAQWGWREPLWFETRADDPGVGMCAEALAAQVDMVLAAGGDGTVRVICAELAGTGVAVGIVPLGTGNLLARNLGLPLHPAEAVETALCGKDRVVDVVQVQGDELPRTCFTVMAGLGFDAAIMAGAPDQLKARMGWPAYVVSALRQVRHPATWVEVSVDDAAPIRRKVRTVVVGNVGSLQAGIPLLPDALIDDGRLDVVVIAPQRTVGWLRLVLRVLRRARRTDERLDRMTGHGVRIRADKPLLRQLDGDPVGEGLELNAEVLPGALIVRVSG